MLSVNIVVIGVVIYNETSAWLDFYNNSFCTIRTSVQTTLVYTCMTVEIAYIMKKAFMFFVYLLHADFVNVHDDQLY